MSGGAPVVTLYWGCDGEVRFDGPARIAEAVNRDVSMRGGGGPVLTSYTPPSIGTPPRGGDGAPDTPSRSPDGLTPSHSSEGGGVARPLVLEMEDAESVWRGRVAAAGQRGTAGGPPLRMLTRAVEQHGGCGLLSCTYVGTGEHRGVLYSFGAAPQRVSPAYGGAPEGGAAVSPPQRPAPGAVEWVPSKWREGMLSPRIRGAKLAPPAAKPRDDELYDDCYDGN